MHYKASFFHNTHAISSLRKLSTKKIGELFIARHAECDHNVGGHCAGYYDQSKPTVLGMTKTFQENKILLASGIKIDRFYVSPLQRALITAQTLTKNINVSPPIISEALVERNFGAFTGLAKNKIKELLTPQQFHRYLFDQCFLPPSIEVGHPYFLSNKLYGSWPSNHKGESYQCVINRLSPFVATLKKELIEGKNILIVGHSHNLQILQMLLYRTSFQEGIEQYKLPHVHVYQFKMKMDLNNTLTIHEKIILNEKLESRENPYIPSCV